MCSFSINPLIKFSKTFSHLALAANSLVRSYQSLFVVHHYAVMPTVFGAVPKSYGDRLHLKK
uniref:Uncharacterized protein n=1 Tax=Anguilla anguilla TaxID=7936 RepID=A0A0E9REK9_ANGAN